MTKKNFNTNNLIMALVAVVLGVLFIWKKDEMLGITFTVAGALFIIQGIISIVLNKDTVTGIAQIVIGAVILACGWTIANVVLIVSGVLLIAFNVLRFVKGQVKDRVEQVKFFLSIVVGVLLACGFIGASWIFIILGIFMIIYGLSLLLD